MTKSALQLSVNFVGLMCHDQKPASVVLSKIMFEGLRERNAIKSLWVIAAEVPYQKASI